MGNIGDPITSGSIPAVGSAGTTYATNLNLFLTEVKNRLESKLPKSSLFAGALDMNGDPIQNASYVGISNGGVAPTTPSNTFQAFGGNVYWINTGGAVQITSGTTLNAALLGGITGDYGGANPAQFRFVDADQEFYAYDDFGAGTWARIWARNFDIAAGASGAIRARLAFGGAGSYTMTLPSALPGSTSVVSMDNAGQLTATNTLTNTITAPDYKWTTSRSLLIPVTIYRDKNASHTFAEGWFQLASSTNPLIVPVVVQDGERITNFFVGANKASDATNTLTARLERYSVSGGQTIVATGTNNSNAPGLIDLTPGPFTENVTAPSTYFIRVFQDDATPSAVDHIYATRVTISRP